MGRVNVANSKIWKNAFAGVPLRLFKGSFLVLLLAVLLLPQLPVSGAQTELGSEDDLTVLGTDGTVPDPDAEIKGFSIFGSTDLVTHISTAAGNVVINGALEVSSNVYIVGVASAAKFYGDGTGLTGIGGNDNLGDHTATRALNMANKAVDSVSSMTISGTNVTGSNPVFTVAGSTFSILKNGYVGIGTASPGTTLDVVGAQNIRGTSAGLWISNSVDSTLGILPVGSGQMRFKTDLAGRWLSFADGAGTADSVVIRSANIGIGTTDPKRRVHIYQPTGAAEMLMEVGDGAANWKRWNMYASGGAGARQNFNLRILNDAGSASTMDAMTWMNNGSVGIGTTAPGYRLHVSSGAGEAGTVMAVSTGTSNMFWVAGDGAHAVKFYGDGSGLTNLAGTGDNLGDHTATRALNMANKAVDSVSSMTISGTNVTGANPVFTVAGSTLSVLKNGNMGLGTAAPSFPFHVYTSKAGDWQTAFQNSLAGAGAMYVANGGGPGAAVVAGNNLSGGSYAFKVVRVDDTAPYFYIMNGGNVGMGTLTPSYPLHVNTSKAGDWQTAFQNSLAGAGAMYVANGGGQGAAVVAGANLGAGGYAFKVDKAAANYFYVMDGGNVGVGTSAPGYRLHVSSGAGEAGTVMAVSTGTSNLFWVAGDGAHAVKFFGDGSGLTNLAGTGDNLGDHNATTRLNMNGNQIIGVSSLTVIAPTSLASSLWVSTSGVTPQLYVSTNGKVGIGTKTPTQSLDVAGTMISRGASAGMYITNGVDSTLGILPVGSGQMRFKTDLAGRWLSFADGAGTTDTLAIRNGYVGIGTTTPVSLLTVGDGAFTYPTTPAGTTAITLNSASLIRLVMNDGQGNYNQYLNSYYDSSAGAHKYAVPSQASRFMNSAGTFGFYTAPIGTAGNNISWATGLFIDNSGDVGVGTGTPGYRLHVSSGAGEAGTVMAVSTGASNMFWVAGDGAHAVKFFGDGSGLTNMTGLADNLGNHIATTTLNMANFNIVGVSTVTVSSINTTAAGVTFSTNVFVMSGNLGINTSNPGYKFHLAGAGSELRNEGTLRTGDISSPGRWRFYDISGYVMSFWVPGTDFDTSGLYWDTVSNRMIWRGNGVDAASIDLDDGAGVYQGNLLVGSSITINGLSTQRNVFQAGLNGIVISTGGAITTTGAGHGTIAGNARGMGAVDMQTARTSAGRVASGEYSIIAGGSDNRNDGQYSVVSGGKTNTGLANYGVIAGGSDNVLSAEYSVISGGYRNTTANGYTVIAGGQDNSISGGNYTAVSGGQNNMAKASWSAVPGGRYNTAAGQYSLAAGYYSSSTANGAFTWSDSQGMVNQNVIQDRTLFKNRGGFLITGSTNTYMTGGVDRGVFITGNGLVGISTGVPYAALDVVSTGTALTEMAQIWRAADGVVVGSMSATGVLSAVRFVGDGSGITGLGGADNLGDHTATKALNMNDNAIDAVSSVTINGSGVTGADPVFKVYGTTFTILANGNVGIGNGAPAHRFTIGDGYLSTGLSGSAAQLRFGAVGASPNAGQIFWGDNTGWKLHMGTNLGGAFVPRLTIVDSGNIGISTANPQARMDMVGAGASDSDYLHIWRDNTGVIVASMTSTGKLFANLSAAGTGDNLGNHIATADLIMGANQVTGTGALTMSSVTASGALGVAANKLWLAPNVEISSSAAAIYGGISVSTHVYFATGSNIYNINSVNASSLTATGIGIRAAQLRLASAANITISSETSSALGGGVRVSTNMYIVGFASATRFYGDGSGLTGLATIDNSKVLKAGDTMTGQLTLAGSSLTVTSALGIGAEKVRFAPNLEISSHSASYGSGIFITTLTYTPGLIITSFGELQTTGNGRGTFTGNARGTGAVDLQVNRGAATRVASGVYSVVAGGQDNTAAGANSTVPGGSQNTAGNSYSTVGGGIGNNASGISSVIPGGDTNSASGSSSFAAGNRANSSANGAFTWADSGGVLINNSVVDRTVFKNRGGFVITGSTSTAMSGLLNRGVMVTGDGLVGISLTTPFAALDIVSTGTLVNQYVQIWRNSNGVARASVTANGELSALKFRGDGSDLTNVAGTVPDGLSGQTLRYDGADWAPNSFLYNDGSQIGIGTGAPSNVLEIYVNSVVPPTNGGLKGIFMTNGDLTTNSLTGIQFRANDDGGALRHGAAIVSGKDSDWVGGSGNYPGFLSFWTRPFTGSEAERMRVSSEGNVGISTNAPQGLLHVGAGATPALLVAATGEVGVSTDTLSYKFQVGGASTFQVDTDNAAYVSIKVNGVEFMRLNN